MSKLSFSVALSRNPMTTPIIDGRVTASAMDWIVTPVFASEMFWRQLRFGEFDISEMSLSSLTIAASQGRRDWVAIPIFSTRDFFHTHLLVRDDAGINEPADLVGKRVGVPEYQQTAAVWSRGALQHEYGVTPDKLRWWMERPPEMSHGGATAFEPPAGVELNYIPRETNIGEMLMRGELDASLLYIADNNLVDRSRADAGSMPAVRPLFADVAGEEVRYYRKTNVLPMNHVVVIRASLLDEHPWMALNTYSAFVAAKQAVMSDFAKFFDYWRQLGVASAAESAAILATDPLPYGLHGQVHVLQTLGEYLYEQGLTKSLVDMTELFAPSTRDL
jgi:4,5-dihydroxyphthalate decarboxylase